MIIKAFRIYGKEGHRQRNTFGKSAIYNLNKRGHKIVCAECNADLTGQHEFTILIMKADSEEIIDEMLEAQLSDGIFENCAVGMVEVAFVEVKEDEN